MNVLIAGDFCPRYRVAEKFERENYHEVFGEIKDIVTNADYSIVNFECPVTNGKERPIEKCGPNLSCSERGIEAVKWAGFDCVTLANNHLYDFGSEGVENTLSVCDYHKLDTVGGGLNLEDASKILFKKINDKTIAIINCCEHEFSIATQYSAGANPLNPVRQYYDIKQAKTIADYVLIIVHGGHEQCNLPSPRMVETYRYFIDCGADAVVNHHQHCISGYEIYKRKPIIYGIGNFCFDNKSILTTDWNLGYFVELMINKCINFRIYPYLQCGKEPKVVLLHGDEKDIFKNRLTSFNEIILDPHLLIKEHELWMKKQRKEIALMLQPYKGRVAKGLFVRNLLPSFLDKEQLLQISNYINCESHLDNFRFIINDLIKCDRVNG